MINLIIDGRKIVEENSYDMTVKDILTDSSVETEAGTKQYDYARKNVHSIDLSYTVTDKWLHIFATLRNVDLCAVSFLNEVTGETYSNVPMKLTNFKYSKNSALKRRNIWDISFTLEEI